MRTRDLLALRVDEAYSNAPLAKVKKLQAFLTADVMVKNHDNIIQALASFLSSTDIDQLQATVEGELSPDDVEFNLDLFKKALPADAAVRVHPSHNTRGLIATIIPRGYRILYPVVGKSHGEEVMAVGPTVLEILFEKGRWQIATTDDYRTTTKRFEHADDALQHMKTIIAKYQARLAKLLATAAEKKVKVGP